MLVAIILLSGLCLPILTLSAPVVTFDRAPIRILVVPLKYLISLILGGIVEPWIGI